MGCVGNRKVLENISRSLEHNPLRTKHFPIPRTPTTTTLLFNNNKNPQKGKKTISFLCEKISEMRAMNFHFCSVFFFCNHRYSPPITESNPTWDSHAHRKKHTQRKCFTESLKKNDDFLFQSMWVCFFFQIWILLLGLWWVSLLFLVFCLKPSWGKVVGYLTLLLIASSSSSSTICYA